MRYRLLLFLFLICFCFCLKTQAEADGFLADSVPYKSRRAKSIYIEALGSSIFGLSINYDTRFKPGNSGWGIRAGICQILREGRFTSYSFPILVNKVNSEKRASFEYGAGMVITYRRWWYDNPDNSISHYHGTYYGPTANVGFRFQPLKMGPTWRIYWSPVWRIGQPLKTVNLLWFGTSLGLGFH